MTPFISGVGLAPFPPYFYKRPDGSGGLVSLGFMVVPHIAFIYVEACACGEERCSSLSWYVLGEKNVFFRWNDGTIEAHPYTDGPVH